MAATTKEKIEGSGLSRLQWSVAIMMTIVMVLEGVDLQLASFSAPVLMHQWNLTKPAFAPLLAAAMIGMAIGTVIGSLSGDRFGRRPTLTLSVAFFGLLTVLCALSSGASSFLAFRFLSGLGFGAAFPVATAMVSEWVPRRVVGKAISIMTIGIPVGAMIGAFAASWFLPHVGWRGSFMSIGCVCLLFAAIMAWRLPESPSFLTVKGRPSDAQATEQNVTSGLSRTSAQAPRAASDKNAGGGVFEWSNARLNIGLWTGVLFNSFAAYAVGGWLTVIFVELRLPLAVALRGPLTVSFSAIIGAVIVGSLIDRFGSRMVMLLLAILAIGAGAAMSFASFALHSGSELFTLLFIGLALGGFCTGGLQPAFYVIAAEGYGTRNRSRGVGVAAVMGRLGAIFSSFAGGAVLAKWNVDGFFLLIAALGVGSLAGILIVDRHVRPGGRRPLQIDGSQDGPLLAPSAIID